MIDLNKPCEGIDYEIVPFDKGDNEQAWQALILRGPYAEHNFIFTGIQYSGKTQQLKFRLDVVFNNELIPADEDLQNYAFKVLTDIILNGIADGTLLIHDTNPDN